MIIFLLRCVAKNLADAQHEKSPSELGIEISELDIDSLVRFLAPVTYNFRGFGTMQVVKLRGKFHYLQLFDNNRTGRGLISVSPYKLDLDDMQ